MTACLARSSSPLRSTTQSLEPADFPETAEEPAIGGLLRLGFGLRRDRFWPEGDFGRSVSRPRNPVSPMQIDLGAAIREPMAVRNNGGQHMYKLVTRVRFRRIDLVLINGRRRKVRS